MKEKWVNEVKVVGYIFDHDLQKRVTGENAKTPGQEFISGRIHVAVDDQGLNVIPIRFRYVTPTYKNGRENQTYGILNTIMNTGIKMCELPDDVKTTATKVRITGQIDVNHFLGRDGEMIKAKEVGGSFCDFANIKDKLEASFKADMLIMKTTLKEPENGDDYLELAGYCFNFRGDLLPLTLSVVNTGGIKYFEQQDISLSNPLLTTVHGSIICSTIRQEHTEESAWGEDEVTITTRTVRAWNVAGSSKEPMEFDDENTITKDELKVAKATLDEYIAEQKKKSEEYRNSQTNNFADVKPGSNATSDDNEDFIF